MNFTVYLWHTYIVQMNKSTCCLISVVKTNDTFQYRKCIKLCLQVKYWSHIFTLFNLYCPSSKIFSVFLKDRDFLCASEGPTLLFRGQNIYSFGSVAVVKGVQVKQVKNVTTATFSLPLGLWNSNIWIESWAILKGMVGGVKEFLNLWALSWKGSMKPMLYPLLVFFCASKRYPPLVYYHM